MTRAVFLDRDGVLTRALVRDGNAYAPVTPAEMEIDEEAAGALARLKAAGFLLIVVTNQPDVARGAQTLKGVEVINAVLERALPIDEIRICCHDDADGCQCRKPKPGMILAAAADHGIDLAASFMVGDRWSDVAAGNAAGCRTVLLPRPYSEMERCQPTWQAADLAEAAKIIGGRGT